MNLLGANCSIHIRYGPLPPSPPPRGHQVGAKPPSPVRCNSVNCHHMAVPCHLEVRTVYCGPLRQCEVFHHYAPPLPRPNYLLYQAKKILICSRLWYLVWVTFYNIAKEAVDVMGEGHISPLPA